MAREYTFRLNTYYFYLLNAYIGLSLYFHSKLPVNDFQLQCLDEPIAEVLHFLLYMPLTEPQLHGLKTAL